MTAPMPDPLTPEGRLRAVREELDRREREDAETRTLAPSHWREARRREVAAGRAMADEWERHVDRRRLRSDHCDTCRLFVVWSDALLGRSG